MEANKIILNGITIPTDTEVKVSVEEGTTIITFSKQESESKEPKFKDGDILFVEDSYGKILSIYKRQDEDVVFIRCFLNLNINKAIETIGENDFIIKKNIKVIRYATEDEIAKLNKEFAEQKHLQWNAEEFKFEPIRWRAEHGETYWHITGIGTIISSIECFDPMDNILYKLRNYFKTEKLANQALPKWKDFFKNLNVI